MQLGHTKRESGQSQLNLQMQAMEKPRRTQSNRRSKYFYYTIQIESNLKQKWPFGQMLGASEQKK